MAEKSAFQSSQFLTAPGSSERLSKDDVCARMSSLLPSLGRNESLAKQYHQALKKQKGSKSQEEAWFRLSDCYTQAKALSNPASGPSDYHWASHYLDESMGKVSRRVPAEETNTVLSSARDDVVGTSKVTRGLAFARLSVWHGGLIDSGPFEDGPEFFKIGANKVSLGCKGSVTLT